MKLILAHIIFFALAFTSIYFGFTGMRKYRKKLQKYKSDKMKSALCLSMIALSIFVMMIGMYLLYIEVNSFIQANSQVE